MKAQEIIDNAVQNWATGDNNQIIRIAYFLGREQATKEICDQHNFRIATMRERAKKVRYHNLVNSIIDNVDDNGVKTDDSIYSPDYAGDFGHEFAQDDFPGTTII